MSFGRDNIRAAAVFSRGGVEVSIFAKGKHHHGREGGREGVTQGLILLLYELL